jgi:hypothetical protein
VWPLASLTPAPHDRDESPSAGDRAPEHEYPVLLLQATALSTAQVSAALPFVVLLTVQPADKAQSTDKSPPTRSDAFEAMGAMLTECS